MKLGSIVRIVVGLVVVAVPAAAAQQPEEVKKAEAAVRAGKADEALALLREAVKKQPTLPPARLLFARLLFAANQPGPGRFHLEQAVAETPDHPECYLTNASQALADGRLTDVILGCTAALSLAEAEKWSADQRKSWKREARAGLTAAFEARKDWEAARVQLLAWLELEPKAGVTRQRYARALLMLGKADEAFAELQQATKDDPVLEHPEVTLAQMWAQKGDTKQAEEWFEKAAQKYPREARVHRAFGGWLLDRGRVDGAKVHIETAANLEPKGRDTLGLMGLLARYTRDYEAAARIFEDITRDEPANFYASNHLALSLIEIEAKRARAVQLAEVNARQYPRLAEALATLGWAYYRAGRLDDADRVLGASVSSGQATSDTAYYLARVLKDKGKPAEAKDILKKALETDGPFVNRADAKALLDELSKTP